MGAADYVSLSQRKLDNATLFGGHRIMIQISPSITVCLLCLGIYEHCRSTADEPVIMGGDPASGAKRRREEAEPDLAAVA